MKIQYTALLLTLCCVGDVFASEGKKDKVKFFDKAKDEFKDLGGKIDDLGGKIDLDKYVPKVNPEDLDKDFHDQEPIFDVLGFTSINAIDLTEGFASGIYDKDVRE